MIPLWATVRVHARGARPLRFWLPLLLVWLLLSPLIVLAALLVILAGPIFRVNPFALLADVCGALAGLTGTLVEIDAPDASVLIRVV